MKKYVKPAISVFAVESQPILAASLPGGVDNTYDFGTDLIEDETTGTYYSRRHKSVWDLDEE